MFTKEDVKKYAWYAVQWAFKQKNSFKRIDCDLYVESELYEKEETKELIDSANRKHEDIETYTREEVRMVALNSINAVLSYMLKEEHPHVTQIINSEIDTVKLF